MVRLLPPSSLEDIAHVIQASIAPVFLLAAVGTLLNVLVNRLGRAVDRRRVLESRLAAAPADTRPIREELAIIARRVNAIYAAIVLAVLCALFICMLIALAFADAFLSLNLAKPLALLFVLAMLALIGSLVAFLREIFYAVRALPEHVEPSTTIMVDQAPASSSRSSR